jgi:hypothetical protein
VQGDRLVGALSSIKARAPVTGGNFGVFGGMFSTFDCAVKGYRQKEDAWNSIISGFLTGGCLAARSRSPASLFFDRWLILHQVDLEHHYRWLWHQVSCWVCLRVLVFSLTACSVREHEHNYHHLVCCPAICNCISVLMKYAAPDAPPASLSTSIPAHA